MRRLVLFVTLLTSWSSAQNGRGPPSHEHNGHGWDIRLAVPGEPGSDYPTLGNIPRTHFSCAGKDPGYYADVEAGCQVFRICTVGSTYGFQSFLCPNGTLFNQDVFVCDWWMNVKCRDAERLTNKFDQFGNLRLGPQLMKDVKKMLTHTMRNPYDKNAMKSNLIVMQDYKPPAGQLFPNGALIAGPERTPSNVYVPAKQILQPNYNPSYTISDSSFAASSTPDTKYIPSGFTNQLQNPDAEVFQRQRQNSQYRIQATPNTDNGNLINGRNQQFIQQTNSRLTSQQPNHNYNQNTQYTQRNNAGNIFPNANNQRGQLNRQRAQYTDVRKPQFNNGKQKEIVSYAKQQYNQEKQPYTYRQPNPTPNALDFGKELKQNLVSEAQPTVITKTLTYSKLINEPKLGRPKSRITVKTWVVKPKSGRLIAQPTSYTYDKPAQTPAERLVEESSAYVYTRPTSPPQATRLATADSLKPYVYNRPTTSPQVQRLETDNDPKPYIYNRPTTSQPERIVTEDLEPYVYNRPTVAAKQVVTTRREPPRSYLPPSPTSPARLQTQAARLNLPQAPPPTQAVILPTTFKPAARLYLPPPVNAPIVSRQYLAPIQQAPYYQNSQLKAAPSTPTPSYSGPNGNYNGNNNNELSYTTSNQPESTRPKNLTFTEILTKQKLDSTVDDIVRDTGSILQTASPQFGQYQQDTKTVNDPDSNYLPAENESGEDLTSQAPSSTTASKSARLVAQPARDLEPPAESFIIQNTNQLSNLPFYKESAVPNTIERTVSLKITLPERIASYIFRGGNDTDYNNLEILNTGSSNYLVLTNNMLNQDSNFIPLGKLSENKNSNVSTSQALVFSFLADSLNAAKKYSNTIKQDILTQTQAPQIKNLNNEDISQIANKVSQLTSSQFSNTDKIETQNKAARLQASTGSGQSNQFAANTKYTNEQDTTQPIQNAQYTITPSLQTREQLYSAPYQTNNNAPSNNLLDPNQNGIYSGQLYQLPVPEVSQIYNRPQSGNIVQANLEHPKQISSTPQATNLNNLPNHNNLVKQSSAEVELVQSQSLPITAAKLQSASSNEPESFYSQESLNNLLNTDNGISAQLQDKIVGIIPHPIEDNKLVSYEKDQSYYLYTKLDNNGRNIASANSIAAGRQNTKLTRGNNIPNVITFQFVPSVSYQLEDEKEQQKLLNSFQIDEFGAPRDAKANLVQETNQRATMVSNVDFTVEHPRQSELNSVNALYKGPSSYLAPQGSIGSLPRQTLLPNNLSSRLEELDGSSKKTNEGYPKTESLQRFIF